MLSPNTATLTTSFLVATTSLGASLVLTALAISFTSPASLFRPALLPLHLYLTYITWSYTRKFQDLTLGPFFIGTQGGFILQYIECVLINNWAYEAQGPTSTRAGLAPVKRSGEKDRSRTQAGFVERFNFGFWIASQTRYPATKWPVKNIPPFSTTDSGFVPNKRAFLIQRLMKAVVYTLILDFMSLGNDTGNDNAELFPSSHIAFFTRLPDVSMQEIGLRILMAIMPWVVPYFMLDLFYCVAGISAIMIGVTSVEQWPPFFGQLTRCTSIRKFWGEVWHQTMRRRAGSPANFITYKVLGLRKGGIVGRYTCILLTFSITGALHIWIDMGFGIPWLESGSMRFFCIQTIGIMIEDAVHAMFKSVVGSKEGKRNGVVNVLGFLWLLAWMSWSMPVWIFPSIQRNTGMKLLPFSLLGIFIKLWRV